MNCSSGSGVQARAVDGVGAGADAAKLPAHNASNIALLRSQRWPLATGRTSRQPSRGLAENRLGLGNDVRTFVEVFDILDGHRTARLALIPVEDGHAYMPLAHFGINGDALLHRDRVFQPRLQHTDLAVHRAAAVPDQVEVDEGNSVSLIEADTSDTGGRLQIAE